MIVLKSTNFFKITLDFLPLLWYCVVLTVGATNGKYIKRTVARKHNTTRGLPNELEGNKIVRSAIVISTRKKCNIIETKNKPMRNQAISHRLFYVQRTTEE